MKYCSQCGAGMQDNDKFCMSCGSAYTEARGSIESPVPPAIPAKVKPGLSLMTKILIAALLAVVLAAGGFWGWKTFGTEARVEKKLDLAVKYISDNNYEQAILAFNDAIKIDPRVVQGYQGLAKAYTLQGNYDEAKNTYEKGIAAVNPQNKQILQLGLAGMYIDQNKLTDAEQAYSEIMNSSPTCLEAYWGLAMVYNQQGENSKAEAILRQAVEKNPNKYRGYNTLALFLSQNNKKDDALNNIVQSLTLEMNQQEAYLVLDSMYQNNWAELPNKTTSLSNQNVAAMIEFYSNYAAGDYPNAINIYQSKLSSQSTNQKAKILAAVCLVKNGDKNSAEALIKQLNISKLNTWLLGDLGRYYLATGDQAKAKDYALKALQANPTNLESIALLQSINANDPEAKIYTAKALLYNWKPVSKTSQPLENWTYINPKNKEINTQPMTPTITPKPIESTAVQFNGHHYMLYDPGIPTWIESEQFCENLGGHLATITSSEENAFVYHYLLTVLGQKNAYFGLTDSQSDGKWVWVTGEKVDYTNWHSGEPSTSTTEDFGMFYWNFTNGQWNNGDFHGKTEIGGVAFICEWDY